MFRLVALSHLWLVAGVVETCEDDNCVNAEAPSRPTDDFL